MELAWLQEVWAGVSEYMQGIALNPANYPILVVTWVGIERLDPIFRLVIAHPHWSGATRVLLYQLVQRGKAAASTVWCLGLVWIPHAQPKLCGEVVAKGCQTIVERLAVACTLGIVLSLGHFGASSIYRRVSGSKKKVQIVCASCRSRVSVESLRDPCPVCGQAPHEVTRK